MRKDVFRKCMVLGIIVLFFGAGFIPSISGHNPVFTRTIVVPDDYPTIQQAIDNASDGDRIEVHSGTYYENIVVNKSLSIIGENKETTVIDGGKNADAIYITADRVNISCFTIQYSGDVFNKNAGIDIRSDCNCISENKFLKNDGDAAVYLKFSDNNIISNNSMSDQKSGDGIKGYHSGRNKITGNNICNNEYGIYFEDYSHSNTISDNIISSNECDGIRFRDGEYNAIRYNIIRNNNGWGIVLRGMLPESKSNYIELNTIENNRDGGIGLAYQDSNHIRYNIINSHSSELFGEGIHIYRSNSNHITGNIISNNDEGIWVSESGENKISGNNITSNKDVGIELILSYGTTTISGNNIINNRNAKFTSYFDTIYRWDGNYWGESNLSSYKINGKFIIFKKLPFLQIPWFNFDWNPAQEPYDIP